MKMTNTLMTATMILCKLIFIIIIIIIIIIEISSILMTGTHFEKSDADRQ